MKRQNKKDILTYAKENMTSFEKGGVSSNEIRFFQYEGKKYVLKTPLMVGDNLSPFWLMMKNIFHFTFEKQNENMENVYRILKENPYIEVAPLVVADKEAMIYEFVEGKPWDEDKFPKGMDNAFQLGQYIGYNHQKMHENCGILGTEDVTDFFLLAFAQMEECIKAHWNSDEPIDKWVREYFESLKQRRFESSRYSLMMVDICADQFLFDTDENIVACVDLDAYVIGPVEWELSFLKTQVEDWESFRTGYEIYQKLPAFEEVSDFVLFLMGLNSHGNKCEMEEYWARFLGSGGYNAV